MRGFVLTDSLIAMALLTLLVLLVMTRSIDVQREESRRAQHALLVDLGQAVLQLSQQETALGTFEIIAAGVPGVMPSSRYAVIADLLAVWSFPEADLVLTLTKTPDGHLARVAASIESTLIFSEEVQWSARSGN